MRDRVRIQKVEVLSDRWSRLDRTEFDYRRADGTWERQVRETYNRGNGAAVLPVDVERGTVLLVRQFRLPAFKAGHGEALIEACAGVLDEDDPETCIRKEAREELGIELHNLRLLCSPFMTPGSVTERLHLFMATYTPQDRIAAGGGSASEGEDIEVLEVGIDDALAAVGDGRIVDAKTIILIQQLRIELLGAGGKR